MAKKIVLRLVKCQTDFFLFHHFPHIYEGISHSAKGRINANIGYISDFLEAKARIMSQDDHFSLIIGQLAYQFPDIFLYLSFDKMIFNVCFCKFL